MYHPYFLFYSTRSFTTRSAMKSSRVAPVDINVAVGRDKSTIYKVHTCEMFTTRKLLVSKIIEANVNTPLAHHICSISTLLGVQSF